MTRRVAPLLVAAIVGGGLILADRQGWLGQRPRGDFEQFHRASFTVPHVSDGDTLDVDCPDPVTGRQHTRIRLWGVDTPCNSLNAAIRRAFWARFAA